MFSVQHKVTVAEKIAPEKIKLARAHFAHKRHKGASSRTYWGLLLENGLNFAGIVPDSIRVLIQILHALLYE